MGELVEKVKQMSAEGKLWIIGNDDAAGIGALGVAAGLIVEEGRFTVHTVLFEDTSMSVCLLTNARAGSTPSARTRPVSPDIIPFSIVGKTSTHPQSPPATRASMPGASTLSSVVSGLVRAHRSPTTYKRTRLTATSKSLFSKRLNRGLSDMGASAYKRIFLRESHFYFTRSRSVLKRRLLRSAGSTAKTDNDSFPRSFVEQTTITSCQDEREVRWWIIDRSPYHRDPGW